MANGGNRWGPDRCCHRVFSETVYRVPLCVGTAIDGSDG